MTGARTSDAPGGAARPMANVEQGARPPTESQASDGATHAPPTRDTLAVHGRSGPLRGTAPLVGDKSISHRALILGAVADGPTTLRNLSPCRDVGRTRDALRALGVAIRPAGGGDAGDGTAVVVHGRGVAGLDGPAVEVQCGDSGTTLRLLAGLLAGQARAFTLDGDPGLRRRPMARVVAPLRAMGADIDGDRPPLRGRGHRPLRAAEAVLAQASAQVGSAVLLAALNADGETRVRYPAPVRDHTERMLAAMGAPIAWDGASTRLAGPVARLHPLDDGTGAYRVPDDVSAAAFLLCAAALVPGSAVRLPGVGVNPGRTGLLEILGAMGAPVDVGDLAARAGEPVATLAVAAAPLRAAAVSRAVVPRAIDELPLVAVLATQAAGRTVVAGAEELRVKECDRIAAIVDGLGRLGARIEARPDGFVVDGPTPLCGARVEGRGDHRIVMALAVAGLVASGTTTVTDAGRTADSYPGFAAALAALGARVAVDGVEG